MSVVSFRFQRGLWSLFLLVTFVFSVVACTPVTPPDEEVVADSRADSGSTDNVPTDTVPVQCKGNNDGIIELKEVTFVTGAAVSVLRNKPGSVITVEQVGKKDDKGKLTWDFTKLTLPTKDVVRTVAPTDKWFLSSFPKATLLIPTELPGYKGTLFQVLRVSGNDLVLDGLASEKDKPASNKVLLPYNTGVPLLRFPLRDGKEWIVESKTNGNVQGLPVASTDKYEIRVKGRGRLVLPYITFENTLRLQIKVSQRFVGGATRRFYQVLYMHECYGEIVRIVSKDGETSDAFKSATLMRAISF